VHLLGTGAFTYFCANALHASLNNIVSEHNSTITTHLGIRKSFLPDSALNINEHTRELSTSKSQGYDNGCEHNSFKTKLRVGKT
jgi:hypothetical protein